MFSHLQDIYTYQVREGGEAGASEEASSRLREMPEWLDRPPLPPPNHGEQQESRLLNYLMQDYDRV